MILAEFPNSQKSPFIPTSPWTFDYNCIAYACGVLDEWYWPPGNEPWANGKLTVWPNGIPPNLQVGSFIMLFQSLGYQICPDGTLVAGFEKVVIFERNNEVTHAAKQNQDGSWTSKLGRNIDVSHAIAGMSGGVYGNPVQYLERLIPIIP
jgi:hypothetical protein